MDPVKITCKTNGAIRIEGEFELYDIEGNRFDLGERKQISLCRCAASQNKPFCDGQHKAIGFQSEIKARKVELPAPGTKK